MFKSIKNSGEVLCKLKDRGFQATSCLLMIFQHHTTFPHKKLHAMIEWAFNKKEGRLHLPCNDKKAFFNSADNYRGYSLWSCQNVCALSFLLDNNHIRFGTKLYRQIVAIPMGTNCAPVVAVLFLLCYERDFMTSF